MPIVIKGTAYDTMQDACDKLELSRATMLRYLKSGFFTAPSIQKQGRGKAVRYFTGEWYALNEARLSGERSK